MRPISQATASKTIAGLEARLGAQLLRRYINLIEEGIDVAIRIGPLNDSNQIARRIGSTEYLTVASPVYTDRSGVPKTVGDLVNHDCIALMARDTPRVWPFIGPAGAMEHVPQGPVRSNDAEYVRVAVIAGLGIGHNAGWLYARDVEEGRLVPLLTEFRPAPFPINAVWPGSRRLPGRTHVFIEFLAKLFAADPLLMVR